MDDVYRIAADIYARLITAPEKPGEGRPGDSKDLANKALDYALDFIEVAHERGRTGRLNLPT